MRNWWGIGEWYSQGVRESGMQCVNVFSGGVSYVVSVGVVMH